MYDPALLMFIVGLTFGVIATVQLAFHCRYTGDTWRTSTTTHSQWSVSFSVAAIITLIGSLALILF